ncbi:MAG: TolC family protein [Methylococcales bacterium]|nr:TolC family protein [Methylococcales bacterium]
MSKTLIKLIVIRLLLSLILFSAQSQAQTISLDETLTIFYQRNLDLIAARYNVDQALAESIAATAIPNPTVSFQIGELSSSNLNKGASATGCNHSANISCGPAEYYTFSQLIEVAGKRGLREQSSNFASQAAESDFRDALRILTNLVRIQYYQLLQAQKYRELTQEIVEHYQVLSQANKLRLSSGDISESDFLRVKMEAMRAETDLDNAQTVVITAQTDLAVVLRWPEKTLQFEAQELWPEPKNLPINNEDSLIAQALQNRPDLQANQLRAEQADKQLDLAQRLKYPDVTVTVGYARDPSNNALNSGFVGLSVPLPLFYQYKGETDKAQVNLSQNRLLAEQTVLSIRKDIISALATWKSADKIVQRFKTGLLTDALTIRKSAELAYSKGATSVLDFIEAQRSYKNIMHDYYTAEINRANAYYDLEKALGTETTAPHQHLDSQ